MNDLKKRVLEALSYLNDDKMQFYKRVQNTLSSFSGLNLTELSRRNKELLLDHLSRVNEIFDNYDIEVSQDYEKIAEIDRHKLLKILLNLCYRLSE